MTEKSVGDLILDLLDEVLYEDVGHQRFEALYLGGDEPLTEDGLF